jgi:hypothetical protein
MSFSPASRYPFNNPLISPYHDEMNGLSAIVAGSAPASGTFSAAAVLLMPITLARPFTVVKAWVLNGVTVGTDSWDIGVYRMTDLATARLDLLYSTGPVLSAGTVNRVAEVANFRTAAANITTGVDSTDATSYTTASVTLKAGRLYLMSFVNTAASADAITSITGGPTWTTRSSTQYNGTAHRVSIWSGVPTTDYTGTIVVGFGANTQTSGRWSLNEFANVDTATTDGVVQQAVGSGNSTTPLATLGAFGATDNATFGALANTADTTTTPGSGFYELSDLSTATTPASFLQTEYRTDNDTTVDGTITSGQWGACAVEIKAAAVTSFVIPPSFQDLYMGFVMSGITATVFRTTGVVPYLRVQGYMQTTGFPLPSSIAAPAIISTASSVPLTGFSDRSLVA